MTATPMPYGYGQGVREAWKTEDQRDKLDAYHEVWGMMAKVQRGQRD